MKDEIFMVMAATVRRKSNKIYLKTLHPVFSIYFEVFFFKKNADPSQGLIRSEMVAS